MTLAEIYDRDFFAHYGAANDAYARACRVIAEEIHRRFRPHRVVDWGCGAGLHAAALSRCGAGVLGVDAVAVDPDLRASDVPRLVADLREPIVPPAVPERYDLSLCIDVLEHIDEADAERALLNVTRGAQLVILSCAPPGQGGHHHVNEQPRRYWVAKMRALGWHYDRRETGAMEHTFMGMREQLPWTWMYHNLCVYRPAPPRGRTRRRRSPESS